MRQEDETSVLFETKPLMDEAPRPHPHTKPAPPYFVHTLVGTPFRIDIGYLFALFGREE
jgi:hypothetical protein